MKTEKRATVFRDVYANLPDRFVRKIDLDLKYILEKQIPGLQRVYLFGSCARNEVRSTSDIDILIVTEKKLQDRGLAADIRWTLDDEKDGVRTDVVFMNEETKVEASVFHAELDRDKKLILEVRG